MYLKIIFFEKFLTSAGNFGPYGPPHFLPLFLKKWEFSQKSPYILHWFKLNQIFFFLKGLLSVLIPCKYGCDPINRGKNINVQNLALKITFFLV